LGQLGFWTSATGDGPGVPVERMTIRASGNVGIGKTNPGVALDVVGAVQITSNLAVDTNTLFVDSVANRVGIGTTNPTTKFTLYGTSTENEGGLLMKVVDDINLNNGFTGIGLGGYSTGTTQVAKSAIIHERTAFFGRGNLMFCNSDENDTTDVSNTHARMTITRTGNVGIGTTNPGATLEVVVPSNAPAIISGPVNPGLQFNNKEGGPGNTKSAIISYKHGNRGDTDEALQFFNQSSSGTNRAFKFLTSGTAERMTILDNGNVGIGVTNPTTKLEVNGDISAGQPGNLGTRMNGGYGSAVKDIWHSTGTNLNGANGAGTVLFLISGNYSSGSAVVSYAYIVHKMFSGAETQPLQFALLSKFEGDGGTGLNRHIEIRVNPANGNLEFRARNTNMNIQFTTLESR
jgi:hypothetical protein